MPRYRSQDLMTAGKGSVIASTTAPVAHIGQRWFNTATGVTYQYTIDAAGTKFWLDISSGGIGTSASRSVDWVGDIYPHMKTNNTLGSPNLAIGDIYYNRAKNKHFVCTDVTTDANVWSGRHAALGGLEAQYVSGTSTYRSHTFLETSTFYVDETTSCDIMIVAGGGGGCNGRGGGGGAGGMRVFTSQSLAKNIYTITIGAGGDGNGGVNVRGGTGGNSSVNATGYTILESAGGGGGSDDDYIGGNGGSGGGSGGGAWGGGGGTGNSPSTSPVQGYNGGSPASNSPSGNAGSGGGGAGGVGQSCGGTNSTNRAGAGGIGVQNAYRTGSNLWYAGGGGGGSGNATVNTFGYGNGSTSAGRYALGGGGDGGRGSAAAVTTGSDDHSIASPGSPNTGGGGGGTGHNSWEPAWGNIGFFGGDGGSGIVVIRYAVYTA